MSLYCSKSDENSPGDNLNYVLPAYEYFHFLMCLADVEAQLFRDNSRGIDGGAFATATLLHRKKARLCKGKEAIDSLKDFITLKSDANFCHIFLQKFGLDPSIDNTPPLLRTAPAYKKKAFLHEKVQEVLKERPSPTIILFFF